MLSITCKAVTSAGGGLTERANASSLRRFVVAICRAEICCMTCVHAED